MTIYSKKTGFDLGMVYMNPRHDSSGDRVLLSDIRHNVSNRVTTVYNI